jgi:hypothetical protein
MVGGSIEVLNLLFTAIFTVELAINALAHWFWPFVTDVWSQIDSFVVIMSIIPLFVPNQNTGIVRILRAFRILRLFRRVPSLRKIITALTMALLPVLNVFCILFLLLGICKRNMHGPFLLKCSPAHCHCHDLQGQLWLYPFLEIPPRSILRWPFQSNTIRGSLIPFVCIETKYFGPTESHMQRDCPIR